MKVGQAVTFCIRLEEGIAVRPDRPLRSGLRENVIQGRLVWGMGWGATHTLFFKADRVSEQDYHLEIVLPHHAWQRLGLAVGQAVAVSLTQRVVHVLAEGG